MGFIADILLVAAALGATFYCVVLSRRLSRFTDLEQGVGGAIATLSKQVDDMTSTVRNAEGAAAASAESLGSLTGRAEDAARRLELLVAALHDLPDDSAAERKPKAEPEGKAEPEPESAPESEPMAEAEPPAREPEPAPEPESEPKPEPEAVAMAAKPPAPAVAPEEDAVFQSSRKAREKESA
ncbi:MAG: hypothetical protein AAGA87_09770 [Pseudomonadota bacterium]